MKKSGVNERAAALACIGIIKSHLPLNSTEKRLLSAIENQIRLAFELEGGVSPEALCEESRNTPDAPIVWFW